MSSSVLLPAPLRPITPTTSPRRTSNETPDSTAPAADLPRDVLDLQPDAHRRTAR